MKNTAIILLVALTVITGISLARSGSNTPPTNLTVELPQGSENDTAPSTDIPVTKINASNVILFNVPVMAETVDVTIEQIERTTGNTVYLVIDSPGGSVVDGAKLIDYIKYSGKNIVTVCDNICASMGFQLLQVGKQRYMTPKAIQMAHPASGGAAGTIENMYELIKMFKLYVDRMDAETAKRAGIPYDKFKHMVADNIWVETPEALSLGLADGVVYVSSNNKVNILNETIKKYVTGTTSEERAASKQELMDKMQNTKGYSLETTR